MGERNLACSRAACGVCTYLRGWLGLCERGLGVVRAHRSYVLQRRVAWVLATSRPAL